MVLGTKCRALGILSVYLLSYKLQALLCLYPPSPKSSNIAKGALFGILLFQLGLLVYTSMPNFPPHILPHIRIFRKLRKVLNKINQVKFTRRHRIKLQATKNRGKVLNEDRDKQSGQQIFIWSHGGNGPACFRCWKKRAVYCRSPPAELYTDVRVSF